MTRTTTREGTTRMGLKRRLNLSKLGRWAQREGLSAGRVAKTMECGVSTAYALINGTLTPGRELGWRIESKTWGEVPFNQTSWPELKK